MSEATFQDPAFMPVRYSVTDLILKHQEFLSLSWKDRTPSEVSEIFLRTYGMLPLIKMQLRPEQVGSPLHRARWVDPSKEDITDPLTYSYPRVPEKQMMGRANLVGIPVFYTCDSAQSSYAEARSADPGDMELFRSEWRFTDPREWNVVAMLSHRSMAHNLPFLSAWERALREFILKCDRVPEEYIILLHDCVAELFLQESYEVTSWIAHKLMQEEQVAEMLIYPSLRAHQQDLCHAFTVAPVDAGRILLHRVEQVKVVGDNYEHFRSGIRRADRIHWNPSVSQNGEHL